MDITTSLHYIHILCLQAQYSCFSGEKLVTESGSCFHNDWVEGSALKDLPDVVFVEMTGRERIYPQLNDNPMLQEYEVLLRRLLRGGAGKVTSGIKQPAVVALHVRTGCHQTP